MKPHRLDQLSDGIFAIILTLLTFELKIPSLPAPVSNTALWNSVLAILPIFLSFTLSFALIFTYWRAHHYITSIYARNIDARLTTINALFFFFIALIPFSSRLLGEYSETKLAIIIYSINIIAIGGSLIWMRSHVLGSGHIDHAFVTKNEKRRGIIRIMAPVVCAIAAIVVSFYSTQFSFILLTIAIVFNLMSHTTHAVNWVIERTKEELLT